MSKKTTDWPVLHFSFIPGEAGHWEMASQAKRREWVMRAHGASILTYLTRSWPGLLKEGPKSGDSE